MNNSPITGKDRILTIDIIRGFALFGIFLVNMPAFHSPVFMKSFYGQGVEYSGIDYWVDVFFSLFVEMKFFTIFSFLFGLGLFIYIIVVRQNTRYFSDEMNGERFCFRQNICFGINYKQRR
ncbi:hypothetical protein [Mesobacillus maritimus]|uniref:hypothetical protein n=1 Tax=Mesobacillus maritimus TaxID=1643336 RepID=UPI003850AB7F